LKEKNYMLLSDYSVCLMKLGKQKEALGILKELYKHYPNDYKIAANLGTAYELNGEVDSALKYIKRDLFLNSNDHEGSEWIHVKVLEAKQALKKDPQYLKDHTVLQLSDKQKNDTLILQQLDIQLQERVPFTPGPDAMMANLFADLGDISANVRSLSHARAYYLLAKKYYGDPSPLLDAKVKEMEKLMRKYTSVNPKYDQDREGDATKIGYIRYQDLLKDNDDPAYSINWEKINTNVDSLLAIVDFKRTGLDAKMEAAKNGSTEGLTLIPEHDSLKAGAAEAPDEPQIIEEQQHSNNVWIYSIGGVLVLALGYFITRRSKKK